MKTKFLCLIIALTTAISFTGCSNQQTGTAALSPSPSATVKTVNFPLNIKDYSGTEITIDKKPTSIVSLTLATDEMLTELVDDSRLKAIDTYAADAGISNVADWAKKFPTKINAVLETIINLKPDLVFLADWKEKSFVKQLRDADIPVFVFKTPTSFEELYTAVDQVAMTVGEPAKGDEMNSKIKTRLGEIAEKLLTVDAKNKPSVFSYSFYGSTYAKNTSFDALVNKAGLINSATAAGLEGWPNVSKEKLIELDPDIIILPSWSDGNTENPEKFKKKFIGDESFKNLKAVKNGKVFILSDMHMQCNSQFMVRGVEDLVEIAYPGLLG